MTAWPARASAVRSSRTQLKDFLYKRVQVIKKPLDFPGCFLRYGKVVSVVYTMLSVNVFFEIPYPLFYAEEISSWYMSPDNLIIVEDEKLERVADEKTLHLFSAKSLIERFKDLQNSLGVSND